MPTSVSGNRGFLQVIIIFLPVRRCYGSRQGWQGICIPAARTPLSEKFQSSGDRREEGCGKMRLVRFGPRSRAPNGGRVTVSRLLALSLALLLAACSGASKSGNKASSADSDSKEWGSEGSSAPSKDDAQPEPKEPKQETLTTTPSCLDPKGDPQQCLHDSDCCKGFYCGIDPAGSPRIKVCLYGGN
jgi:hypothetical protein